MNTWIIARKNFLEMWHEPQVPLLQLLVPLMAMLIFWGSYNGPLLVTHPVLISGDLKAAAPLIQVLQTATYPNGHRMFDLRLDPLAESAEDAIRNHTVNAQVTVKQGLDGLLTANIYGDAAYMPFISASTLLESVITPYLDARHGFPWRVEWQQKPIFINHMKTLFDPLASGILVFLMMMLGPQAAIYLGREVRWGTLQRLHLTPLHPAELLTGITLAQTVMGLVLTLLILFTMQLLDIYNQGNWILILLVVIPLAFSSIGMGLLAACFAKNDFDAYNITSVFVMPQVLLSGAFYPMPPMTIFTLWGHELGPLDLIPANHAVVILRQIFLGGAGLEEIAFRLTIMLVLSLLYFSLGTTIFGRFKLRRSV